jgi:hypothetical protein
VNVTGHTKGVFARLATGIAVAALLAVSVVPVSAQVMGPTLDVSNPSPGDYVPRGRYVMTGVACDPAATSGSGISQVTVYLGNRDTAEVAWYVPGGYLGTATLGLPTSSGLCGGVQGAGWSLKTKSLRKGSYTLFVYATSSVTGMETVKQIPFKVDRP